MWTKLLGHGVPGGGGDCEGAVGDGDAEGVECTRRGVATVASPGIGRGAASPATDGPDEELTHAATEAAAPTASVPATANRATERFAPSGFTSPTSLETDIVVEGDAPDPIGG